MEDSLPRDSVPRKGHMQLCGAGCECDLSQLKAQQPYDELRL